MSRSRKLAESLDTDDWKTETLIGYVEHDAPHTVRELFSYAAHSRTVEVPAGRYPAAFGAAKCKHGDAQLSLFNGQASMFNGGR